MIFNNKYYYIAIFLYYLYIYIYMSRLIYISINLLAEYQRSNDNIYIYNNILEIKKIM